MEVAFLSTNHFSPLLGDFEHRRVADHSFPNLRFGCGTTARWRRRRIRDSNEADLESSS